MISAGRLLRPGALALAAIMLAGCGTAVGGGTAGQPAGTRHAQASAAAATASAGVPLCAGAQKVTTAVTQLTVSRSREILPRKLTITDTSRARALAAALCGLPPMPRGLRCPAALGGALRVEFTAGGHAYRPLRIQDSGCASVAGIGPLRQWSWSSRPGQLLSGAAGGHGRLVPGTHPSSVPTA
jgi:hypothetical protein